MKKMENHKLLQKALLPGRGKGEAFKIRHISPLIYAPKIIRSMKKDIPHRVAPIAFASFIMRAASMLTICETARAHNYSTD